MLNHFFCRRDEPMTEEDIDHEEEFYYNEVEVPLSASISEMTTANPSPPKANMITVKTYQQQTLLKSKPVSSAIVVKRDGPATIMPLSISAPAMRPPPPAQHYVPILSDHMDMARPPHENPEYNKHIQLQLQHQSQSFSNGSRIGSGRLLIPNQQPMFQARGQGQQVTALPITIPVSNLAFSQATSSSVSVPNATQIQYEWWCVK